MPRPGTLLPAWNRCHQLGPNFPLYVNFFLGGRDFLAIKTGASSFCLTLLPAGRLGDFMTLVFSRLLSTPLCCFPMPGCKFQGERGQGERKEGAQSLPAPSRAGFEYSAFFVAPALVNSKEWTTVNSPTTSLPPSPNQVHIHVAAKS